MRSQYTLEPRAVGLQYMDEEGAISSLTPYELHYFQDRVRRTLGANNISVRIIPCDHLQLHPDLREELAISWYNQDGRLRCITIDTCHIHECYSIRMDSSGESLIYLVCRELARQRYPNQGRWRGRLIEEMMNKAAQLRKNPTSLADATESAGYDHPICCICGQRCDNRWGAHPWPTIAPGDSETYRRCCNWCYKEFVAPARKRMPRHGKGQP